MNIPNAVRASIAAALERAAGVAVPAAAVQTPARRAEASWRAPDRSAAEAMVSALPAEAFPPVLGVLPVARVAQENGWLLFSLSDALYDAAVAKVNGTYPPPASDGGRHSLNRMLLLAGKPGAGCPKRPRMQRALWLTLLLLERPGLLREAERALLTMTHDVPPRDRAALHEQCGALAGAAARLLNQSLKEGTP